MSQQRMLAIVGCAIFVVALVLPGLAAETTPGAILGNPAQFDGATVTLAGTITNLRATTSRKGNAYYTFDLAASGQSIRVFSFGASPCPDGAGATVDGRFDRVKRVSGRTFYNEVTAVKVICR